MADQTCTEHTGVVFETFCVDHEVLCCRKCLEKDHSKCKRIMSLELAVRGSRKSRSFTNSLEFLEQVISVAEKMAQQRKDVLEKTKMSAIQVKEDILKIKDCQRENENSNEINNLVESLLKDLSSREYQMINDINHELSEIVAVCNKANNEKSRFEKVKNNGTDFEAFMLTNESRTCLADLEASVTTFTMRNVGYIFKFKTEATQTKLLTIGSFELIEVGSKSTFCSKWMKYSQGPALQKKEPSPYKKKCDFDTSSVGYLYVYGMTAAKGKIYLSDSSYKSSHIFIFDGPRKFEYAIETPFRPWDIAVLPESNFAYLTSNNEDILQVVDLNSRQTIQKLNIVDSKSGGVAVTSEGIYVGTKGSICVLNHEWEQVRKIELLDKERKPWFITLNKDKDILYTDKRNLVCITQDGQVKFTYKFKQKQNECPWNVAVDNDKFIFVAVPGNGVYRFKPNGKLHDIVVKEWILKNSLALCFNESCDEVYISYNNGANISVLQRLDVFR